MDHIASTAEDLVDRLGAISEIIDDLSFNILRAAADGDGGRPDADRVLVRARRSVEKAAVLLGELASSAES